MSRTKADRALPGADLLGKRLKIILRLGENEESWIRIVGVVDDVKYAGIDEETEPIIYFPADPSKAEVPFESGSVGLSPSQNLAFKIAGWLDPRRVTE